jgi:hypothetical protein
MIPAVNGLVEVAKKAGLPKRFAPLLAVALGIMAGIGLRDPNAFHSGGHNRWSGHRPFRGGHVQRHPQRFLRAA